MSSAIRGLGSYFLTGLRIASPFILDPLVYQLFINFQGVRARTAITSASLAGSVAIWKIVPQTSQKIVGGLYLAYIVFQYISTKSSISSNTPPEKKTTDRSSAKTEESEGAGQKSLVLQLPDPGARYKQYQDFIEQFELTYQCSNPKVFDEPMESKTLTDIIFKLPDMGKLYDEKIQKWSDPQIHEKMGRLIEQGVEDLEKIYQSLENMWGKNNPAGMVNTLDADPEIVKWLSGQYISLKHFYELARYQNVVCNFKNGTQTRTISFKLPYTPDNDPFLKPGTPEYQWRQRYNQVMNKFAALVKGVTNKKIQEFLVPDN